jgi:hypothetical protein
MLKPVFMETHSMLFKIKELTQNLLICDDDFLIMKQSADQLYFIFSAITGITGDNYNKEQIILPSGKAISPSGAAHCLLEFRRTAIFLRGINKAIQQKLSEKGQLPVRILYAGTGPYATLIIPLLTLYSTTELEVDLLDINEISMNALSKLFGELGLTSYIDKTYLFDAATFSAEKEYDIVISETMQAALKKEPQVAIMQNLIPQMPDSAIFIPEAITVSAALVSNGHWDNEQMIRTDIEVHAHKDLFTTDKHHLDIIGYRNEIEILRAVDDCNKLELYTIIKVFENEILKDSDCSLTMPLKVCELDKDQTGIIRFWYEQGEIPGIRCQIAGNEQIFEAIDGKIRNHIKPNTSNFVGEKESSNTN